MYDARSPSIQHAEQCLHSDEISRLHAYNFLLRADLLCERKGDSERARALARESKSESAGR